MDESKKVASNPVVNCVAYCKGKRVSNVELDAISDVLQEQDKFVWIGLNEPTAEMLAKLKEEFGLHELAIEDALRAHQRPKIETYGDSLFIVLRTAQMSQSVIESGETHFFVGTNYIITIRHGSSIPYTDVRARCESTPHLLQKGPGFALYAVMDSIVDQYFPVLEALAQELERLEDRIFDETASRETTKQIYHLKHQLLTVKRSVSPLVDICNRLMRFDLRAIQEETRVYFRDVYDHAIRINELVDNGRDQLSAALEANLSLISISQSEVSKRFAGWAAIIGVPTMVAGIYGMNFHYMPELEWPFAYPLIMCGTFSLCGVLYYRFRRSGWL